MKTTNKKELSYFHLKLESYLSEREIKLREVHTAPNEDYFLEITSPSKAMTEASMNRQWRSRFEAEQIKMSDMTSHLAEYDVSFFSLSFHTKETVD